MIIVCVLDTIYHGFLQLGGKLKATHRVSFLAVVLVCAHTVFMVVFTISKQLVHTIFKYQKVRGIGLPWDKKGPTYPPPPIGFASKGFVL